MHRTLPSFPENKITHKGAIRKPNQCKATQLIHNGVHIPTPDPTKELSKQAKHAEIFLNLHSSLISIGKLCEDECIGSYLRQAQIHSKEKQGYHH